jgi:hypothetical protein
MRPSSFYKKKFKKSTMTQLLPMTTILNFIKFRPAILESKTDDTKRCRTIPSMDPFLLHLAKERMISGAGCLKCDAVTQLRCT